MANRKVYIATSWSNEHYDEVREFVTSAGLDVSDWRQEPFRFSDCKGGAGAELAGDWQDWPYEAWHQRAFEDDHVTWGAEKDWKLLAQSEAVILAMPCGRSAHMEAGVAIGTSRPVLIWYPDKKQSWDGPDLIHTWAQTITADRHVLRKWLADVSTGVARRRMVEQRRLRVAGRPKVDKHYR